MRDIILNFPKQLTANLEIVNADKLAGGPPYIVAGMGGSALAPGILFTFNPSYDIIVHRDYGLPELSEEELNKALVILSSHSGNTEEVIDAYNLARERGLNLAVISSGGQLLERAKKDSIPYIEIPEPDLPPRMSLGFSVKALALVMGDKIAISALHKSGQSLDSASLESAGKGLAQEFKDHIPVIYASTRNKSLAYNWKIKYNETAKVPAFCNVLPEANHNEMDGFDVRETTAELSRQMFVVFIYDDNDDHRVQKRMKIMADLLRDRKIHVRVLELEGQTVFDRIFNSLITADWTSYYLALNYGLDPAPVPMIEEFKKLL